MAVVLGSALCRKIFSWRRAAVLAVVLVAVFVLPGLNFGDIVNQRVTELILNPGTNSNEHAHIWGPIIDMMLADPIATLHNHLQTLAVSLDTARWTMRMAVITMQTMQLSARDEQLGAWAIDVLA